MPNIIVYQPAPTRRSTFHALLIEHSSAWGLVPFVETVGANLCQNFYFLLINGPSLCGSNEWCEENISIILCVADFFASGIQNTYQRFWKSWEWAWIPHLSTPTASFINTLKNVLNENRNTKVFVVYISQSDLRKINVQDNNETETPGNKIYKKFVKQCTLTQSLELLSAYFKVDIFLVSREKNIIDAPISQEEMTSYNISGIAERHITHFNYSLDFIITTNNEHIQKKPLTLTLLLEHLQVWDWEYLNLIHQQVQYCELLGKALHPFNLFCNIFLGFFPYMILMFQTVGMLYKTMPNEADNNIFIANCICIFGIRFGLGKGTVNNALRREMAEKNLKKYCHAQFYKDGVSFFTTALFNIFFGMKYFTPFSWDIKKGVYYIIPALLRLLGINVGISISFFYLYVALFTQNGIELIIKTLMRDFSIEKNDILEFYHSLRFAVDFVCVISSLSYNGLLTQYIESCNKCDALAKRFENWLYPPGKTVAEILFNAYVKKVAKDDSRVQYKNFKEKLHVIINALPKNAPLWQVWYLLLNLENELFTCTNPVEFARKNYEKLHRRSNRNDGAYGAELAHDFLLNLLDKGISNTYFTLDQKTQKQVFKSRDDLLQDTFSCNPYASLEIHSMFSHQNEISQNDPHIDRIINSLPIESHTAKEHTPIWIHASNLGDILVFGMSATSSIAGFLAIMLEIKSLPYLAAFSSGLIAINYALIAGICAGLANLIFTYAAAAPGQMKAWGLLSKALQKFSCASSAPTFFHHSQALPLLSSVESIGDFFIQDDDRSPNRRSPLTASPTPV